MAALGLNILLQITILRLLPAREVPEIRHLVETVSRDPLLLVILLGPVLWIGVALFEELTRVFLLDRLWSVWRSPSGRWTVLVFSAGLFGLAHLYQGPDGIIGTGFIGLLFGWFYMASGRVWPLIIGHALYDTTWILTGLYMVG